MKQVLFRVPGLGVPLYGFGTLLVVAFCAGMLLAARRSRRERLDPEVVLDLAAWVLIGGVVGARLFFVAEYWGEKVTTAAEVFHVWDGGIVLYGGLAGGLATLLVGRAFRTFPVLATLDAVAPSVALGVALGRVGCFLNGCCYGHVCDLPWLAVRFPRGSLPWLAERAQGVIPSGARATLPLHPTQLYAALDGLVLFALLSAFYPLRRRDGEVAGLLMLAYPVTRFWADFLRDDETPAVLGLTAGQLTSLVVLAFALLYWSLLTRFRATRHAASAPAHPGAGQGASVPTRA